MLSLTDVKQKKIVEFCDNKKIKYDLNVSLRDFSYFKTGGIVKNVIYPTTTKDLFDLYKFINGIDLSFKVVGETSNLLFLDDYDHDCLIVTTCIKLIKIDYQSEFLVAETGALLPNLARFALLNSITGFEGLEGIPGTVGGAVFMNAGAYGYEIKDVLIGVEVITPDAELIYLPTEDLKLTNRSSIFRNKSNGYIVTKGYFKISKSDPISIYRKMSLYHSKRHKYQEFMYPTLGSLYSGSVYRSLAKRNAVYKVISSLYFLIFYKWKIFRRESPNDRVFLNTVTAKMFNIKYSVPPFSEKDMNTLTNRGQHTNEFIKYIAQLDQLIGRDVVIENEIVPSDYL